MHNIKHMYYMHNYIHNDRYQYASQDILGILHCICNCDFVESKIVVNVCAPPAGFWFDC